MNKSYLKYLLLVLLVGCSTQKLIKHEIRFNYVAAQDFSNRIQKRYQNYAEESGYNRMADSIAHVQANIRDGQGEPYLLFNGQRSAAQFMIYTFDKTDSCNIMNDTLMDATYLIPVVSFPIPRGSYLLDSGTKLEHP